MKKVILAALVSMILFACTHDKVSKNETAPEGDYMFRAKSTDLDGTVSYSPETRVSY